MTVEKATPQKNKVDPPSQDNRVNSVVEEFFKSERSYYNGLHILQEAYIKQLTTTTNPKKTNNEFFLIRFFKKIFTSIFACAPDTQTGLEEEQQARLILFLEKIPILIQLSEQLQKDLEPQSGKTVSGEQIAQWFIKHAKFFLLYKDYIHDYNEILVTAARNPYFNQRCAALKAMAQPTFNTPIQDITWYAITPVQRIARYGLLFTELLKNTPETQTQPKKLIKQACEQIKQVAQQINEKGPKDEFDLPNFTLERSDAGIDNIISPLRVKAALASYHKEKTKATRPLSEESKTALFRKILKNHAESVRSLDAVPEKNEHQQKNTLKRVNRAAPKSKRIKNSKHFKKVCKFYRNQRGKTCRTYNRKTLKISIATPHTSNQNWGTYYIKQNPKNTSELIYETPVFSEPNTDALSHLVSTACEDAVNAAIAHRTKTVFDFSKCQLPNHLQGIMYRTFTQKLNSIPTAMHQTPFVIHGFNPELLAELEGELEKPRMGLHRSSSRNRKKR